MVQKVGGNSVNMFSDSRFIVGQVKGELEARDKRMQEYLDQAKCLQSHFDSFSLLHILRSGNTHADSLAMLATSSGQGLPRVILVEDLYKPSVTKTEMAHVHHVRVGPSWMDPLVMFLKEDILPDEKIEVDKTRRNVPRF